MSKPLLACLVLLSALLSGCDPYTSHRIAIRLKPEKTSAEIVLRALSAVLQDAGFQHPSEDSNGEGIYQADVADGAIHTTARVVISCHAETDEITIHVSQFPARRLTPKMKALLADAKERVVNTGRVAKILAGKEIVYRQ